MMKHMMNMTPHTIDIFGDEGFVVTVPPSGTPARVAEQRESAAPVQIGNDVTGLYIPASRATYGAVTGLPEPDGETIYIVSALVLVQCAGRDDVFAPGPAIRDDAGRQIGCHGLSAAPAAPAPALAEVGEFLYEVWRSGAQNCPPPDATDAARLLEAIGWERAEMRERAAVEASHA